MDKDLISVYGFHVTGLYMSISLVKKVELHLWMVSTRLRADGFRQDNGPIGQVFSGHFWFSPERSLASMDTEVF